MTTTPDVMPATAVQDLIGFLCTGEDHGIIAQNVVANFNFPHTTFTVRSREEAMALRDGVSQYPWVARVERIESTATGFLVVADIDVITADGGLQTSRTVTTATLDEQHIVALQHWCTGQL